MKKDSKLKGGGTDLGLILLILLAALLILVALYLIGTLPGGFAVLLKLLDAISSVKAIIELIRLFKH